MWVGHSCPTPLLLPLQFSLLSRKMQNSGSCPSFECLSNSSATAKSAVPHATGQNTRSFPMTAANQPAIAFDNVSFRVNGHALVHDLALSVNQGETLVLLGRSGSGKTTSLRLI